MSKRSRDTPVEQQSNATTASTSAVTGAASVPQPQAKRQKSMP